MKCVAMNVPHSNAKQPYKLAGRTSNSESTRIDVNGTVIGGSEPVVIAGPCSVENREQILSIAQSLRELGVSILRGGAFKPRTSPYFFQGLGEQGLRLLAEAREATGMSIITEVMDTADVELVADYADILQIGSRNMQNYSLLKAVGRLQKPVMLKRGMSAQLMEFLSSAEYILAGGNTQVILCERGIRTFVEYSRNTLDLNIVPAVKALSHLPIIVDTSHGTGKRSFVEPMSIAALAAGADGLMVEVHPHPDQAMSDAEQALSVGQFTQLLHKARSFAEWRTSFDIQETEPANEGVVV